MDAYQIKQHLADQLRSKKQFVSAGVMHKDGTDYVLIRLLSNNFNQVRASIPNKIGDVEIRVEKSEPIMAFSL